MSVSQNRRQVSNLVKGKHANIKVMVFATMIPTVAMFLFTVALTKYLEFSMTRDLAEILNESESARYFLVEIWNTIYALLFVAFGGVGLISLWLSIQIINRLIGPITAITQQLQALVDNNYTKRINLRENDYLEEVEDILNKLSQKLENENSQSVGKSTKKEE